MDKGLRNTFIGAIVTISLAFIGAWIQINSRIAVLEIQVQNNKDVCLRSNADMEQTVKDMNTKLQQILVGVQHLQDVKKDKYE